MPLFLFTPPTSLTNPSFYSHIATQKINQWKLSEPECMLVATWQAQNRIRIDEQPDDTDTAIKTETHVQGKQEKKMKQQLKGTFQNFNTIETFKKVEHKNYIEERKEMDVVCIMYADLKAYKFYYWFAFPTKVHDGVEINLDKVTQNTEALSDLLKKFELNDHTYTLLDASHRIGYLDYSDDEHPSWNLRKILFQFITNHPACKRIEVIAQRSSPAQTMMYTLTIVGDSQGEKVLGWEKNPQGKQGPRVVDLSSMLHPDVLARQSAALNLRLLKWRTFPDLDLDLISKTSCLLLGSGTLGCTVSRSLLSWGVRKMTFVDNGKVSLSNPVRQCLFTAEDARTRSSKVDACKRAIDAIVVDGEITAVDLTIPMAGHTMTPTTLEDLSTLSELVAKHDVIFLLTDSREARWLPTLLGRHHQKFVINCALGAESWVVMRHGGEGERPLGCYFCNDVIAPTNTLSDRSLDQQCTVTRPGVSFLAGSTAVELMVNGLHHKDRQNDSSTDPCALGSFPHHIRGQCSTFEMHTITGNRYKQCIACSDTIIEQFRQDEKAFVTQVMSDPTFLENATGFDKLMSQDIDCEWVE